MDKPSPQKVVSSYERFWEGIQVSQDCIIIIINVIQNNKLILDS